MQGKQVWPLVKELRSWMPQSYWAQRPRLESPCIITKDAPQCSKDPGCRNQDVTQANKSVFKKKKRKDSGETSGWATEKQTEMLCWEDGGWGQLTGKLPRLSRLARWVLVQIQEEWGWSVVRGWWKVRSPQLAQSGEEDSADPGSLPQGPGSPGVRVLRGVWMEESWAELAPSWTATPLVTEKDKEGHSGLGKGGKPPAQTSCSRRPSSRHKRGGHYYLKAPCLVKPHPG